VCAEEAVVVAAKARSYGEGGIPAQPQICRRGFSPEAVPAEEALVVAAIPPKACAQEARSHGLPKAPRLA